MAIATKECQNCNYRKPADEMMQIEIEEKTGRSGDSFSFDASGFESGKYYSGRDHYRTKKIWVCISNCGEASNEERAIKRKEEQAQIALKKEKKTSAKRLKQWTKWAIANNHDPDSEPTSKLLVEFENYVKEKSEWPRRMVFFIPVLLMIGVGLVNGPLSPWAFDGDGRQMTVVGMLVFLGLPFLAPILDRKLNMRSWFYLKWLPFLIFSIFLSALNEKKTTPPTEKGAVQSSTEKDSSVGVSPSVDKPERTN